MYEQLFQRLLYPAYETHLRRRKTLAYLRDYEASQWKSPDEIAALRWRKLESLLDHCYREVPYYRSMFDELGIEPRDIRSIEDYRKLPRLTKADIKSDRSRIVSRQHRGRTLTKATGGSTGVPLELEYTRESYERRSAVFMRAYSWAGATPGSKTLYVWGVALLPTALQARIKHQLYHGVLRNKILNSFEMTDDNIDSYADAVDSFRPKVIVGYVAALVRLARHIIDTGRRVHRPEGIISAAEALLPFQRALLEEAFGCPVFNTYGCREFMSIAAECPAHEGLHVHADHLLVETVDEGGGAIEGASGDVLITDLHNYGMPFIRYEQGDRATLLVDKTCSCGRGLPLMGSVDGRKLDMIRTRDGRTLPGEFFPHLLKDVPGVERFQVVQDTLDHLEIKIVRGDEFDDEAMTFAKSKIREALGSGVDVEYRAVDDIELTPTGKSRVTISRLDG